MQHLARQQLTTGELAQLYHVPHWHILQLFKRGFLPEPPRIGSYRVFSRDDLPAVEAALIAAGYLPHTEEQPPCK